MRIAASPFLLKLSSLILTFLALPATANSLPGGGPVTLIWDDNVNPLVVGYNLHYGTASGIYTKIYNASNSPEALLSDLQPGETYYCAVTAYDSLGIESEYSDELVFTYAAQIPFEGPYDRLILIDSGDQQWQITADPNDPQSPGIAQLQFEVAAAAPYVIWCRIRPDNTSPMQLAVSTDAGPEQLGYLTATAASQDPDWMWARIETDSGNLQLFDFSADIHLLSLRSIGGFEIDRVAMSSDPNFIPSTSLPVGGDAVSLTLEPQGRTVEAGVDITLNTVAVGTGTLYYQWYKDGEPIPGATFRTLTIASAVTADSGSYTVVVWSGSACTESQPAMLQVFAGPAPPLITGLTLAPDHSAVSFQMPNSFGTTFSVYASGDLHNWSWIGSATNSSGTFTVPDQAGTGAARRFYKLVAEAGSGEK